MAHSVLAAIRSLNGCGARRPEISMRSTAWTEEKQRAQHRAQLEAGANADRKKRSDEQIVAQYHAHMAKQRAAKDSSK